MKFDIEESLSKARDYIDRIGDEVTGTFEGQEDTSPMRGLVVEHGSHNYLVMASEDREWVRLRYPINIDHHYALQRLGVQNPDGDIEISDSQINQARSEFDQRLDEMSDIEKREFRLNLIHMLSRESTILTFDTTGPLNIHGFNLDEKLFLHEPDFMLSDYHQGVQRIINLGWVGKEFILDNYGFRQSGAIQ